MSMSQEEIEALMNGLDTDDEESKSRKDNPIVNTNEIEELISKNEEKVEVPSSQIVNNDDIDSLLKELETKKENNIESTKEQVDEIEESDHSSKSFNDVSADEEGIVESKDAKANAANDEIGKNWAGTRIDEGIFPFPADPDTKVVSQLSQVANDSEEKVSRIFDVLSLALDNNNDLRNKMHNFEAYVNSELELMNSLSNKFPNIEVFNTQKESSTNVINKLKEMNDIMNQEDIKIFEGMELMQFNDINRQKIERVMSVIRKLSLYLNNLFEDDGSNKDIAVAKHIPGDIDHDLIGDDLDKLINEFGNKG